MRSCAVVLMVALALLVSVPRVSSIPVSVEVRCGWSLTPYDTNVTWLNGTNVPEEALLQFINNDTMAVLATTYIGVGMFPMPGDGRFYYSLSWDDSYPATDVFIRCYDTDSPGTSNFYGDSAVFTVSGTAAIDVAGWFLNVPLTPTGGGDKPLASTPGTLTLRNTGYPILNDYDLKLGLSNLTVLNQQMDVETEYYFEINVTDLKGRGNLENITVRAWYDNGSEATAYGTGTPNTQFALRYNFTGNPANETEVVSQLTAGGPEVTVPRAAEEVWYDDNTTTMRLYFVPGRNIRHAPGFGLWDGATNDGSTPADGFNDIYSWNFEVNITNADGFSVSGYDEFGVYRYTTIHSTDLDIVAMAGMPGELVLFPLVGFNYSTNADYDLYVYVNSTFVKVDPPTPADSIPATAISAAGGDLATTPFAGTGASNSLYVYTGRPAPVNGIWEEVQLQFSVLIPFGTLSGFYVGEIVYTVDQS